MSANRVPRATVHRPVSGRVRVHMKYQENNRDLLRGAGPGARPAWEPPFWTVSRTAFDTVVRVLVRKYGCVAAITDGRVGNKCDTRCREARGDDCICSCAGTQHGIHHLGDNERVVGETTIVDMTIARWRRVICRSDLER
jgi:hypothetical protein